MKHCVRASVLAVLALAICALSTPSAAAKQDHEYVKPIDWSKVALADDELTRWHEKNVILWQLENRYKPLVLDPSKIDKMSGTACAFLISNLIDVIKLADWDEEKVGIAKEQLIALVDRGVKRIYAEYIKNPASLHNSTADGCGQTWGALLAWGTWAVWEHLSEDSQKKAVEVLLKEAKIFEDPLKTWNYPNSNIEEHSTQATFFSLLANMMPEHPLNKHWEYCTRHWTYGHVVSPAELRADPVFSDGTRLRDYVGYNPRYVYFGIIFQDGGSIHNDGSIMNHWTVNYGYSKTTSCRFASLLWYKLASRTPPEGLTTIGVKRTRDFFVRMIKPWGGHIGPNGNYGRYGHLYGPIYHLLYWDPTPEAWAAFQTTFNAVKKLVETGSVGPGYNTFGNYYQAKLFGPLKAPAEKLTTKQLMTRLSGVHVSPTAKYVVHRSPESYSVYSWHSFSANGGMLDMDPVVQDTASDGGVVVRSKRAKDTGYVQDSLIPQSWVKTTVYGPVVTDDGFSVITRRDSKYGVINHTAFVSLPNCNTVLVSRTIAREDMEVDKLEMGKVTFLLNQERLGLGINKWPWWGDHKLRLPEGRGPGSRPAWVNVGNRMGYVAIGTSPTASVGGESVVFERYTKKRAIKAGGEIGRVILVTFPGVTAEETARLADGVQLLRAMPKDVYAVRVPKTKGLSAPVWVLVNFGGKAVDITLPLEAGGDGKVTVKARSCLVVRQGPARKG